MHFVGTSLLGANTRALHRPLNQVAGVDIDDAKPGASQMSAVALRNCGSLLRSRNGSLEQAFHVLDAQQTGRLTLEAFTKGMQQFGSSPEDAKRLFQQMDIEGTGSVALPAFLAALRDETEQFRPSLPSPRQEMPGRYQTLGDSYILRVDDMGARIDGLEKSISDLIQDPKVAARLSRLESQLQDVAANKVVHERLLHLEAHMHRLTHLEAQVADMSLNTAMLDRLKSLEAKSIEAPGTRVLSDELEALRKALFDERMARDAQEQALFAECESIKLQNAAQMRAVSQGASSALVSELQSKLEVLRVQLEARVEDLVATQVQGEMASLKGRAEGLTQHAESLEARCQAQCTGQLDALRQRLESHMHDMRAEWRAEVQSESVDTATKYRELERSIVEHAVAEAGSTVLAVKKDIFHKDEGDQLRSQSAQNAERLAVAEDHLKMLRMEVDRIRTLFSSGVGSQGTTSVRADRVEAKDVDDSAESASVDARISETAVRLEGRILSVSQNVQTVSSSIRAEVGDLRSELRRLASVDITNLVGNVAKLQIQSDEDRKQVDNVARQLSEAGQNEAEMRAQEDQRVEGKLVEQLGIEVGGLLVKVDTLKEDVKAQAATLSELAKGSGLRGKLSSAPKRNIPNILQERLESIIKKMDNKCIEDLAPDLRQLSVLLSDEEQTASQAASSEHGESISTTAQSCPVRSDDSLGKSAADKVPPGSPQLGKQFRASANSALAGLQASIQQATRGGLKVEDVMQGQSSDRAVTPSRGLETARQQEPQEAEDEARGDDMRESASAMRRLREDILSYLHVEFQEMLSNTLKKSWPNPTPPGTDPANVVIDPTLSTPAYSPQQRQGGSVKLAPHQAVPVMSPRDQYPSGTAPAFPNSSMGRGSPGRYVSPLNRDSSRDQSHGRAPREDSQHKNAYGTSQMTSRNYPSIGGAGGSGSLPRGSMGQQHGSVTLPRGSSVDQQHGSVTLPRGAPVEMGGSMTLPLARGSVELQEGSLEMALGHLRANSVQKEAQPPPVHRTQSPSTAWRQVESWQSTPQSMGASLNNTTPSTLTPSSLTPSAPFSRRSPSPKNRYGIGPGGISSVPGTRAPSASSTSVPLRASSMGLAPSGIRN